MKEHDLSSNFSQNPPISLQDLEDPDKKVGISDPGRDFFPKSDLGHAGFCIKPQKTGSDSQKTGHPSTQELTLSYLCENPKMGFLDKEDSGKNLLCSLEKGGSYKGKEVIWGPASNGDDRWGERDDRRVERDFLQLNENKGSKRSDPTIDDEIEPGMKEKKAKIETLNLSLALPDVSLSLASSNPLPNPDPSIKMSCSIQSLAPSNNNTRTTYSDDFAPSISYSYSHPFSHNPSCSLTRNSTENYEYSVGSRRKESDQIWYCGEGTNGSVHSRFKPIGDAVTFSNNSGFPAGRPANKDGYNGLYRTNSSENLSFFPSELPARQRKDTQSANSTGRGSEQRKIVENSFASSDGGRGLVSRPEKILREIISGSVSVIAQTLQELPEDVVEAVKEYLRNLVGRADKREELASLQRRLDRRLDLTFETLSKCHKTQLDILVTVKTGLVNYVSGKNRLPTTELIEIFLLLRCRNMTCKNMLPVEDCDCKICATKKGFCSACMCPICMNFDCASNTCSWVGCDACSHWCHAVCGMQMHLIKPGPSSEGAVGTAQMQFHCLGCGQPSEMFGFVKDVFMCCAKDWGLETLMKELDCVRKIFQGSVNFRDKELHSKAEEMFAKLNEKLVLPVEACNSIMQLFKYGVSEVSHSGGSSKDLAQSIQRSDVVQLPPPTPIPLKSSYNMNGSSVWTDPHRNTHQSSAKPLSADQLIEAELKFGMPKKDDFDSLESIVRIKEAEARMFQSKADDARREAEKFRQLVRASSDKLEEEYAGKLAKLCLQETEERRRKKLEELKVLENSQCDYHKMKLRMEEEIAGLLERMEATKQQWV
ncbi:protein OBERON 3 [Magnolia sinica]|uniref:protein OBERON 3 n=1 Tax=Magnolia sinica TaxID=86752 RepID=UPI00265844FC|nr:protein OBERON 3 [Magnolia sinica]